MSKVISKSLTKLIFLTRNLDYYMSIFWIRNEAIDCYHELGSLLSIPGRDPSTGRKEKSRFTFYVLRLTSLTSFLIGKC